MSDVSVCWVPAAGSQLHAALAGQLPSCPVLPGAYSLQTVSPRPLARWLLFIPAISWHWHENQEAGESKTLPLFPSGGGSTIAKGDQALRGQQCRREEAQPPEQQRPSSKAKQLPFLFFKLINCLFNLIFIFGRVRS